MINDNQLPPSESKTESEEPANNSVLDIFRLPVLGGMLDEPLPDYWSVERDRVLLNVYNNNNFASSAIQTVVKIVCGLPIVAKPDDMDDDDLVESAQITQAVFDAWWGTVNERGIVSLLVQDNGMFLELTGEGEADQPIEPTAVPETNQFVYATGMRFLEAARCTRTGIEDTPIRYQRDDGKEVLLHKSRVLFFADGESVITSLYGIGLCTLSRFFDFAKNGYYTSTLDNESMAGTAASIVVGRNWPNPPNKSGEGSMMEQAFQQAYMRNRDKGRNVYQEPILLMPRGEGIEPLEQVALKRFPDGYDKAVNMQLIMQMFALASGFETRTFWPASQTGATKADAELSHLKEKSKFLAWFIDKFTSELNRKFAPNGVTFTVDYTDDEQDMRSAEVTEKRINYFTTALTNNLLSRQTVLELMTEDDIISVEQFERELMMDVEAEPEPEPEPMPEEPEAKKKAIADTEFEDELDILIEQANSGDISESEFNSEMEALIVAAALAAWQEGSGLETPNAEQQAEIDDRVNEALPYVTQFGAAVVAADGVERLLRINAPLWANNIRAVFEIGRLYNSENEYLRWSLNGTAKHCTDCLRLGGQVHTREEWQQSGYRPASHSLKCKGFCKCQFVSTSGPSSGGF